MMSPMLMESSRGRLSRHGNQLIAVLVILAALLAVFTRNPDANNGSVISRPTDDQVVIGLVADLSGPNSERGRDLLRGVRAWLSKVTTSEGIPYGRDGRAAVTLMVRDDRGSPGRAARSVRNLASEGATVIIGPNDAEELEAVAEQAVRSRRLLLAPVPRPLSVQRATSAVFLARPAAGDFGTTLDLLDRRVARGGSAQAKPKEAGDRKRGTVALLTTAGRFAGEASSTGAAARNRGYAVQTLRLDQASSREVAAAVREADLVLVVAPLKRGVQLFRSIDNGRGGPWVLSAPDVATAIPTVRPSRVALSVPWSPSNVNAGPVFGPGEFRTLYEAVHGTLPTTDSAAGAALGIVISEAVARAQSTDTGRLVRAINQLETPSMYGVLAFEDNQQVAQPPYVELIDRREPKPVWPIPPVPARLGLSQPPSGP